MSKLQMKARTRGTVDTSVAYIIHNSFMLLFWTNAGGNGLVLFQYLIQLSLEGVMR